MDRRTVLAAGAVALAGCADAVAPSRPDAAAAETQIVDGINELRAGVDAAALERDDTLATGAREHSTDMAKRDFYAHTNPDGEKPWDRVPCQAGENIHRGELGAIQNVDGEETWNTYETADLAGYVVEGWRLSDGHYELLTNPRWSRVGVGVHVGDSEFFATAMFC